MMTDDIIRRTGEYHPIEEWASYVPALSLRGGKEDADDENYNGIEALHDHADLLAKVKSRLEEFGFHRLTYMGNGGSAIVFRTVDDQLVRISVNSHETQRIYHPAILQPIYKEILQGEFASIRFEILPEVTKLEDVNNLELHQKLYTMLEKTFNSSNLTFSDLKAANIGILRDGTPIVIDGGAAERMWDKPILIEGEHLEPWFTADAQGRSVWKQHFYFPTIGTGEITGSITQKDIRSLEDKGHHRLAKYIREQKISYRDELGASIVRAAQYPASDFLDALKATYGEENRLAGPDKRWRQSVGINSAKG